MDEQMGFRSISEAQKKPKKVEWDREERLSLSINTLAIWIFCKNENSTFSSYTLPTFCILLFRYHSDFDILFSLLYGRDTLGI